MPISYYLILYRFLLGPVLFLDALDGSTGLWFVPAILSGFGSDVFDGVIARRTGMVTAQLREWDGRVDVWFIAWIAACAWRIYPELILAHRLPLLTVLACQIVAWMVDFIKYHRFSNYHTYTARAWGVTILIALIFMFGFGEAGITLWLASVAGIVCSLEEILITLALPRWTYDVPSILHAWKMQEDTAQAGHTL